MLRIKKLTIKEIIRYKRGTDMFHSLSEALCISLFPFPFLVDHILNILDYNTIIIYCQGYIKNNLNIVGGRV